MRILAGQEAVVYRPEFITDRENVLAELIPTGANLADVIQVAITDRMEIYSDIVTQRLVCISTGR